jgi:hypothetical protein
MVRTLLLLLLLLVLLVVAGRLPMEVYNLYGLTVRGLCVHHACCEGKKGPLLLPSAITFFVQKRFVSLLKRFDLNDVHLCA